MLEIGSEEMLKRKSRDSCKSRRTEPDYLLSDDGHTKVNRFVEDNAF